MAETTYNLTIPHTSPYIYYDNFKTECPATTSDGVPVCDDTNGFHVASNSSGVMRLKFIGRALYVYGSVDAGMQYTWTLDYSAGTKGTPNGDLLIAVDNLQLEPFSDYFTLEINLAQFTSGARFQFSKAEVILGTGLTGAQTIVDSYKPGNQSLLMTTGWTANDTITGYEFYQSNAVASQTAILDFQGIAVWVWGFCGPRGQFVGGNYGDIIVDAGFMNFLMMSNEGSIYGDHWIAHRCLIYWSTGLASTKQHNITYDSSTYDVLLESVEVLRIEGGTRISSTPSASTFRSLGSTSVMPGSPTWTDVISVNDSETSGPSTGAIVGGVIGGLLAIGAIVAAILFFLKKQRSAKLTGSGQAPGQVPLYYSTTPASPLPPKPPQMSYSSSYTSPTTTYGHPGVPEIMTATSREPLVTSTSSDFPTTAPDPPTFASSSQTRFLSTSARAIEQHRDDPTTTAEVTRLRQEMDAMMAAMYEQQRNQRSLLVDGGEAGWAPPPEYPPSSPPPRPGTVLSTSSWQPPSGPPPVMGQPFPQEKP